MKKILLLFITIYKKLISPLLPRSCRFYPTCSSYAFKALKEKQLLEAIKLIFVRLIKCHPFNPGGYDPLN